MNECLSIKSLHGFAIPPLMYINYEQHILLLKELLTENSMALTEILLEKFDKTFYRKINFFNLTKLAPSLTGGSE